LKWLVTALVLLLLWLQVRLWSGEGSVAEVWRLRQALRTQQQVNTDLQERNRILQAEVLDLKEGLEAIEERARSELGMIKEGETFFLVIEED